MSTSTMTNDELAIKIISVVCAATTVALQQNDIVSTAAPTGATDTKATEVINKDYACILAASTLSKITLYIEDVIDKFGLQLLTVSEEEVLTYLEIKEVNP